MGLRKSKLRSPVPPDNHFPTPAQPQGHKLGASPSVSRGALSLAEHAEPPQETN